MGEMFYRDESGNARDELLWADILGPDDQMTWDADCWACFPSAGSPAALWPRLLSDAAKPAARSDSALDRERSYQHSYPAFLEYFRTRNILTSTDVVVAANFTYAWMPRIAILNSEALPKAVEALNAARRADCASELHVRAVGRYLGGSLVAASKLLHFAAPHLYAIWDTRVARYLGIHTFAHGLDAGLPIYRAYLCLLRDLLSYPEAAELEAILSRSAEWLPMPLRQVEHVMFRSAADDRA